MGNPVAWFEVVGKDGTKLRNFYSDVFGWKIAGADGDMDYGLVQAAAKGIGGGIGRSADGGPGHVTVYIDVDDIDAYLKKVEKAGGSTVMPPMEIASYQMWFALFADPEGHLIGLTKNGV
jgi:predicted enzyme related to lactoylglutathione lyase